MMGAVLTQRTSWRNVTQALNNVSQAWGVEGLAEPRRILDAPQEELVELLRPAGHFNSKPRRLKLLAEFVLQHGGIEALATSEESTAQLREELLGVWGIGPETADAILLYALQRTAFVADAYALRLASRWGLLPPNARYSTIQGLFTANLPPTQQLFSEWHALIVEHGKELCRPQPLCTLCPLNIELSLGGVDGVTWRCPKLHVAHEHIIEGTTIKGVSKR